MKAVLEFSGQLMKAMIALYAVLNVFRFWWTSDLVTGVNAAVLLLIILVVRKS